MASTLESTARALLTEERDSLRRQLGDMDGLELDHGFADTSQVAAEQGEARALSDNLGALLNEVERALARLDDGAYGTCEVCQEPISEVRLGAMPATRYCLEHAQHA
ncbi:MAG: TraR/DksA C4-type zinc finger protein [Acidimicrobiia bacterium]|nr:TraR/DksA C4-type zinc finger protein [Acidimicrobiia bacterium]